MENRVACKKMCSSLIPCHRITNRTSVSTSSSFRQSRDPRSVAMGDGWGLGPRVQYDAATDPFVSSSEQKYNFIEKYFENLKAFGTHLWKIYSSCNFCSFVYETFLICLIESLFVDQWRSRGCWGP